uniref:hypothetical protein n=1 Tax=Desulfosarcina cetonica TaxID=90730 RepID=UPI001C43E794
CARKQMTNKDWKIFLALARRILGKGFSISWASESWCAYTTFNSLERWLTYWTNGLPDEEELLEDRTIDGGLWRQSFYYKDLAHIIIPARFCWERTDSKNGFQSGYKSQDIKLLSTELNKLKISHRITDKVLEIKLY